MAPAKHEIEQSPEPKDRLPTAPAKITSQTPDHQSPAVAVSATANRGVAIGGDAVDSMIITGDQNQVIGTLIVGRDTGVLELEIRIQAGTDGRYPMVARILGERRQVRGQLIPPFSDLELRGGLASMRLGELDADAREFGSRLFAALFPPPFQELYDLAMARQLRLRLRLVLEAHELHQYPWELLFDPARGLWLSRHGTVVRGTAAAGSQDTPHRPVPVTTPFRVLLVDLQSTEQRGGANPSDTAVLERTIADLEQARQVTMTRVCPSTAPELREAIAEAAGPDRLLDAIHIVGPITTEPNAAEPTLALPDRERGTISVGVSELGNLVCEQGVQMIAYSAVSQSDTSMLDLLQGSAPVLLAAGIGAIVGVPLTGSASDDAHTFRAFYSALCSGEEVDQAIGEAVRRRSRGERAPARGPALPICYLTVGEPLRFKLLAPPPTPLTWATWYPWARERVTLPRLVGAGVTASGAIAIGAFALMPVLFPPPLPPMTGTLNIAVAEFGQLDAVGAVQAWDRGAQLATQFADGLNEQGQQLLAVDAGGLATSVQVRGPAGTRRIVGATVDDRERAANELAREIQADVLVYGNVSADRRRFTPELYLSDRLGLDIVDPGYYAFGTIQLRPDADLIRGVADQEELKQRLLRSTVSLAHFTLGLNAYSVRRYEQAAREFEAAAHATEAEVSQTPPGTLQGQGGLETLYQFLGDVLAKQATALSGLPAAQRQELLAMARAQYERAISFDPEYARARVGLAESTYLQSFGSCRSGSADTNADGLVEAVGLYNRALTAKHQTAISNVPTKIDFGLGRTTLCLSQIGVPGFTREEARRRLTLVSHAYENGNLSVKDWATEAHGVLGALALLEADLPRAADEFANAIRISLRQNDRERGGESERRNLFCQNLGRTHGQLRRVSHERPISPEAAQDAECLARYQQGLDQAGRAVQQPSGRAT